MDLHLKHWRNQEDESETQPPPSPKIPRLTLDTRSQSDQPAFPLFVPNTRNTHLSQSPPSDDSTRLPRMGGGFFSRAQWQELELQALIYRHMLAGAAIPPELLQPIIKKTLIDNPPHPYFLHYPHLPPALLQSGFWGRAALDPEPGRCRRTDGKKWRCARDVAAGHKYCERHLHRGRNRSRKPVEFPTNPAAAAGAVPFTAKTPVGGGGKPFALSEPLSSTELLHLSQRSSVRKTEKDHFGAQNEVTGNGRRSDGQVLRHFFDDWPRSLQEADNAGPVSVSATSLSISTPGIPSSDTSLKLSTGNTIETVTEPQELGLNWASGWGTNQVSSMGGPLAEALRSSVPNSPSPISVLHQLNRGSGAPETSYVST